MFCLFYLICLGSNFHCLLDFKNVYIMVHDISTHWLRQLASLTLTHHKITQECYDLTGKNKMFKIFNY